MVIFMLKSTEYADSMFVTACIKFFDSRHIKASLLFHVHVIALRLQSECTDYIMYTIYLIKRVKGEVRRRKHHVAQFNGARIGAGSI